MALLFNILLFALIFGYAIYTLVKFFNKSKAGKCNTCDTNPACSCEVLIDDKRI
ncbi:FeoB-associated Cys-rich membrane protein [Macrococcus equipercicus]|uniref:FeoB-associated Cys-rich membrane protein n=1 Tax=Macrococcus equipercicus TaxID=69967 RepID=A0A9Q9F140_9STAP|nr:FeoB-associated Cys-rich membrane protein [Macrococcus equipercicus]KAA1037693.1 FeoB-associated Cys-rich membrane protein [Macrococcus equipercicus]UTH13405.1 FeoB-associated Cys-rich membrane protein [Macrococcus equipercicus]